MARIRKGDLVVVRTGDDAGKRGRVLRVAPAKERALVEGVNIVFRHLKKSPKHPQGGRIQRENWVRVCTLLPVDPTTDAPTRVSWKVEGDGKRRVARKTGAPLEGDAKARSRRAKAEG